MIESNNKYTQMQLNQYNELAVVQVLPSLFQSMDVIINVKASF